MKRKDNPDPGTRARTSPAHLKERIAGLRARLEGFRKRLSSCPARPEAPEFPVIMQELLAFIRAYEDREAYAAFEKTPDLSDFRDFFGPRVLRFIWLMEDRAANELMSKRVSRGNKLEPLLAPNPWGAYAGMRATLDLFDPSVCRRLLLAGCGPFPDSLFCLHDHTRIPQLVGIDRDPDSLCKARALVGALGLRRIRILEADACDLDYGGFNVICCSIFLTPRQPPLERIAATARPGSLVILREPFFTGSLLFDRIADSLDARFEVLAESSARPGRFMLKYYLLRIRPLPRIESGVHPSAFRFAAPGPHPGRRGPRSSRGCARRNPSPP